MKCDNVQLCLEQLEYNWFPVDCLSFGPLIEPANGDSAVFLKFSNHF